MERLVDKAYWKLIDKNEYLREYQSLKENYPSINMVKRAYLCRFIMAVKYFNYEDFYEKNVLRYKK